MKLQEMVKKYKGTCRFDVNAIVNDNVEDVVGFLNSEIDAIKENIVNADVVRFRVSDICEGIPTIKIDVKETADAGETGSPSESGTDKPETEQVNRTE